MPLDISQQLAALDKEEDNILPTAPIGFVVQWFERGEGHPKAAQVVGIEGPGKLTLQIHEVSQMPRWVKGVLHAKHPQHAVPSNPNTVRNGKWDYIPNMNVPGAHKEEHQASIADRRARIIKHKEEHDRAEEARQAKKEQAAIAMPV